MFIADVVCYLESMDLDATAHVKCIWKGDEVDKDISPERTTDNSSVYLGLFSLLSI